jgi:hypothetical protein
MKFAYSRFPCNPTEPFPNQHSILRPVIDIAIIYKDQRIRVVALVDSGADWCLFPASIGEQLKIPVDQGKKIQFRGATATGMAYCHEVTLEVGGWGHNCLVGFSSDLDKMNVYPILGHNGFFDHYEVNFNFKKEIIEVKKSI